MAQFSAQHFATLALPLPPADALARWRDPDVQLRCRPEVQWSERPAPGQLRMKLREMKHGPTAFAGDYTLQFDADGATLRWKTVSAGALQVHGQVVFAATAAGCSAQFSETAAVTMELPGLVARVVKPLVETMMARGSKGFAERMAAELGGR